MGRNLVETNAAAKEVFRQVSQTVGLDMEALCFESDEETLRQTQNAQLALFTCGVAAFRAYGADKVDVVAGHSVGEYAALVAAGVFSLEDGARLVQTRGQLMARSGQSHPGTMAAVLGLDRAALDEVCAEAGGIVVVANDNCPGQLVISGEIDAVKKAGELAQAKGAKRVLPLNVSGAFHSPLMAEPAREMGIALRAATLGALGKPVYCNVTAQPIGDVSEVPDLLERQLASPVRWTETIQNMAADGVDTIIEFGVGEVLCGLIRRIGKSIKTSSVQDAAGLDLQP